VGIATIVAVLSFVASRDVYRQSAAAG